MPSIFSQPQNIQGGFRADQVSVSLGGITAGMLITRVGISFEQPLNMVYALENSGATSPALGGGGGTGSGNNVYMIAGRPSGSGQIERIVGPTPIASAWLTQFGNACNVLNNSMSFAATTGDCTIGATTGSSGPGANNNSTGTYTLNGVVIVRFGLNVSSEQAMIQNSLEMRFADLVVPTS